MFKELTKRQKECLAAVAQGKQYEQIAQDKKISPHTVRNNIIAARKKLGATTTAQAVILAISREELGLSHDGICFVPYNYS